jgi:L-seryl-tRNA(Ser) seleniumtransferase
MLSASGQSLQQRAQRVARELDGDVVETRSAIGGGSLPGQTQPSWAVALRGDDPDRAAARLRHAQPPVVGRIEGDRLLLDIRTVLPEQDEALASAVSGVTLA